MEATMNMSNLVLPTSGYELDSNEMCYVEGGGTINISTGVQFTLGGFLSSAMISSLCEMVTGSKRLVLDVDKFMGGALGGGLGGSAGAMAGGSWKHAFA